MNFQDDTIDRRRVFSRLSEKERDLVLFDMISNESSERAKLDKRLVDFERDFSLLSTTLDAISHRKTDTLELDTMGKIKKYMEGRFDIWIWFREKVLPGLIQWTIIGFFGLVAWAISQGWGQ